MSRYRIPAQKHRVEQEILRSRFITSVAYTPTVEAARDFIAEIRAEFADASHNCWAYLVGPPASSGQIGYSDDGEPHGTAGKPMFTVLQHSGLGDIAVVVTRYFGGTLLGKGGLVRAYSGGVKAVIEELETAEHVSSVKLEVVIDYASVTPLQRLLPDFEADVVGEDYAADVTYRIQLPQEQVEPFSAAILGLTNGLALVDVIAE